MCEQTTFNYKGRCFTSCPEKTYMLPEKAGIISKSKSNDGLSSSAASLHRRAVISNVPQKRCGDCHVSCYKCRGPNAHECTECTSEAAYREVNANETYCDRSEHDDGSSLKVIKLFGNDHSNSSDQHNFSHKTFFQIYFEPSSMLLMIIYIIAVTVIALIVRVIYLTYCSTVSNPNVNDKKNYAYNRIAYDGTNDHIIMEQEMNLNISDSSEETETIK